MTKEKMAANVDEFATHQMDLQMFAEGEPAPEPSSEPMSEPGAEPSPEPTPASDPEPQPNPEPSSEPDVTQTQAFSKRLKEATQKAIDEEYARLYGAEYGIYSKADYDRAVAEAEAERQRQELEERTGLSIDEIKPLFEQLKESDPDFQELKAIRAKENVNTALTDLNNELKDAGVDLQLKDLSNEELAKVPNIDKVTEYVKGGHSLADAFFLANKKDIISRQAASAQQEAIKKIEANGQSSPGSLGDGGEDTAPKAISQMSSTEFNKLVERVKKGEKIIL